MVKASNGNPIHDFSVDGVPPQRVEIFGGHFYLQNLPGGTRSFWVMAKGFQKHRAKVDVVVLLAALHREEAGRIVTKVGGIDLVVGSYGGIVTAKETRVGDTWLLYAGNQGKRIGESRVYAQGGKPSAVETHMHLLTRLYPHNQDMLDWVNEISETVTRVEKSASAGGRTR